MMNPSVDPIESDNIYNQFADELLELLVDQEESYPWNPQDPETEAYFNDLENNFCLTEDLDTEEIESNAQTLFACLHQSWQTAPSSEIEQSLQREFGYLVPSSWLQTIAHRAKEIISENLSTLDQLVECVKPLLNNWAEDDLRLFARPIAYPMRSMRSGFKPDSSEKTSWNDLSEPEKARLSMQIAQKALEQWQETKQELS